MKVSDLMQILKLVIYVFTISIVLGSCEKDNNDQSEFTDPRDGQSYRIVQIGNQTWFAENLKYAGSLPNVAWQVAWYDNWNNGSPKGTKAWCFYDNNGSLYGADYGKLYNWYAAKNGNICPSGWHIPSDAEWSELIDHLGGLTTAGSKMKATYGWNYNSGGTDESGFSGKPGGWRDFTGNYWDIGETGIWWSSSDAGSQEPRAGSSFALWRNRNDVVQAMSWKASAYSCRCVKDY